MTLLYSRRGVTVKRGPNLGALGTNYLERSQVKAAAGIVNQAIACLEKAHRRLKSGATGDARKYARRYFLSGPGGPSPEERNIMLSVLVLTWNGLKVDRTVVVEHGTDPDAQGWTKMISVPTEYLAQEQAQFPERRTYYDAAAGGYVMAGEINVAPALLAGERKQAVVTFIHEATHRYANTQDFDQRGYSTNGVVFNAPGLTKLEALENAESYGWFAFKVGR